MQIMVNGEKPVVSKQASAITYGAPSAKTLNVAHNVPGTRYGLIRITFPKWATWCSLVYSRHMTITMWWLGPLTLPCKSE